MVQDVKLCSRCPVEDTCDYSRNTIIENNARGIGVAGECKREQLPTLIEDAKILPIINLALQRGPFALKLMKCRSFEYSEVQDHDTFVDQMDDIMKYNEMQNDVATQLRYEIMNSYVNATTTVKIVLNKEKQIWKPKGKLSDNSLNKTKQIWKPKGKLSDNSLNKTKQEKKVATKKRLIVSQWRPTGKKFALGKLCPLTKLSVQCSIITTNHQVPNKNWGTEIPNSPHSSVFKCRSYRSSFGIWLVLFQNNMNVEIVQSSELCHKVMGSVKFGNDHLRAIMGYGDYVIGDSVILRVYYVEGLGHNLFSVGQFCDSDLEVAFRKHTCFVRDINGTYILKGSRSTNLYSISIDEMMKSSPICLLSKASNVVPMKSRALKEEIHLSHRQFIRTDKGRIRQHKYSEYYEGVGIFHQKSNPRTPQQNSLSKDRNRTLEDGRHVPMMIFSKRLCVLGPKL
ncbi:integrase, catalytic region, zinc finger, CCHC-type containing protein [Tanacetum coccineum]